MCLVPRGESYLPSVWCWTPCQALCYWAQHSVDRICWLAAQDTQLVQNVVHKSDCVCAPHLCFGDNQHLKILLLLKCNFSGVICGQ